MYITLDFLLHLMGKLVCRVLSSRLAALKVLLQYPLRLHETVKLSRSEIKYQFSEY